MEKKKKVLIAFDSFKECISAEVLGTAVADHINRLFESGSIETEVLSLSDGGEGFLKSVQKALELEKIMVTATGPCGEPVNASYGFDPEKRIALIEMAEVAGLDRRNPEKTTSFGVGELMKKAYERGARKIFVGVGGSATNDGGLGALQALGLEILCGEQNQRDLVLCDKPFVGRDLNRVRRLAIPNAEHSHVRTLCDYFLPECKVVVCADVTNVLLGSEGSAFVFGPQKGASPEMCTRLDDGLARMADCLYTATGRDVRNVCGGGAAGGIAASFYAFLDAEIQRGIVFLSKMIHLEEKVRSADLVLTGEGSYDSQTTSGKAVSLVQDLGRELDVPVLVYCGKAPGRRKGDDDGVFALASYFPVQKCICEPIPCMESVIDKTIDRWPILSSLRRHKIE